MIREADRRAVGEMVRISEATQQILARGEAVFFEAGNAVEFGAARMAVLDLQVAADAVSDEFKATMFQLPWRPLARTRDKYAHHYEDIDRGVVWDLLIQRLPALADALRQALD